MNRFRTVWVTERAERHQRNALAAAPPELDVVMLRLPSRADLLDALGQADFLISERVGAIDADLIAAAPSLKLIERMGSMAYDIDLEAARARGVVVVTWPVRGSIMVAEHLVLQMLALAKRLRETSTVMVAGGDWGPARRTDEDTFAFNWTGRQGLGGLWQRTIGILGFGEVGAELAHRLRTWDCSVIYQRRRRLPATAEAELGITYASWDEVLTTSDFVVNLLPYSAQTDQALGAAQFAAMKPGSYLASCGSGSVVDEAALAEALRTGHLSGAALDTFEWEPLPAGNPLLRLAVEQPACNLLLTPHVAAGVPPEGTLAFRGQDYTPILRYLRGESLTRRLA